MQTLDTTDTAEIIATYEAQAKAALELNAAEVAARIRPYVANFVIPALPDITFSVHEEGIYFLHGYWRVPICPSRDPMRLSLLASAYTDLQEKLRECEGFLVTLEIGD